MKIRFYHWWIRRLYFRTWSPLMAVRPEMVRAEIEWMTGWLEGTKARCDGKTTEGEK